MYQNIRVQTAQVAVAVFVIWGANNKATMKMNEEMTQNQLPFAQIRCSRVCRRYKSFCWDEQRGYPGPTKENGRYMLGYRTRLQRGDSVLSWKRILTKTERATLQSAQDCILHATSILTCQIITKSFLEASGRIQLVNVKLTKVPAVTTSADPPGHTDFQLQPSTAVHTKHTS
jgi:hypothetical protein